MPGCFGPRALRPIARRSSWSELSLQPALVDRFFLARPWEPATKPPLGTPVPWLGLQGLLVPCGLPGGSHSLSLQLSLVFSCPLLAACHAACGQLFQPCCFWGLCTEALQLVTGGRCSPQGWALSKLSLSCLTRNVGTRRASVTLISLSCQPRGTCLVTQGWASMEFKNVPRTHGKGLEPRQVSCVLGEWLQQGTPSPG